jgi:AraC family transcriptional regulator
MLRNFSGSAGAADFAALSQEGGSSLFLLQGDFVSLHYSCQPPITWSEQTHDEAKVMVLLAPAICRMRWRSGSEAWNETTIRGPAVCLIPPGLLHIPQWECEAELIALFLSPVLFNNINGGAGVLNSLCEPAVFGADDLFVWQFFSSLRHLLRQHSKLDKHFLDGLGTVATGNLILALRAVHGVNGSATTFSRQKLRGIIDHIQANLARSIRVKDLAKKTGLSRAHFAEVFKNTTGVSPHEYVTRCRVLRAQDLLATGEHRISEVAELAGFCDQSHLNRHFKKLLGYSPKVEAVRGRESRHPF